MKYSAIEKLRKALENESIATFPFAFGFSPLFALLVLTIITRYWTRFYHSFIRPIMIPPNGI